MSDIDKWIEIAKECKYLPENDLKVNKTRGPRVAGRSVLRVATSHTALNRLGYSHHTLFCAHPPRCNYVNFYYSRQKLCDMVCDLLLEESNIQPVSTPVTVCGDIHGQVSIPDMCLNLNIKAVLLIFNYKVVVKFFNLNLRDKFR